MNVDLHCHTTASDGALRPAELLARATANGVDMLAITDHDTVAAYAQLGGNPAPTPRVIPGIEFSCLWRGHTIHVVGLGIDPDSRVIAAAVGQQQAARAQRATIIASRMERLGCVDALARAQRIAGTRPPARPDFARLLVESGRVKSIAVAFRKFLGPGKPGDVRHLWPALESVIDWIHAAGGASVLAHPGKYRLTNAGLGMLVDAFAANGGQALEVLCGRQSADLTTKLARIADTLGLHASCGSDFHAPGQPWSELGGCGALPDRCHPVWELLPEGLSGGPS